MKLPFLLEPNGCADILVYSLQTVNWKVLSSKHILTRPWMTVGVDEVELPEVFRRFIAPYKDCGGVSQNRTTRPPRHTFRAGAAEVQGSCGQGRIRHEESEHREFGIIRRERVNE